MPHENQGPAELAEWVRSNVGRYEIVSLTTHDGNTAPVLIKIDGQGVGALPVKPLTDPFRSRPERREGVARMEDLDSFVAHVNRFKDGNSALFANPNRSEPHLLAVLDYHQAVNGNGDKVAPAAQPRFGVHRTLYKFPLSDEWTAWQGADGKKMGQGDFAEFLEDRIGDVLPPPVDGVAGDADLAALGNLLGGNFASPSKLVELSRGLAVHQNSRVKQAQNISTGEISVQYEEEHRDATTGEALKVPNLFLIAIPVFRSGALYRIAVRLRYRVAGGGINWFFELYRADKVFEYAVNEAAKKAKDGTDLPLFMGAPEGAPVRV